MDTPIMATPVTLQRQHTLDARLLREQALRAAAAARRMQELFHTDAAQYERDYLRFFETFRQQGR